MVCHVSRLILPSAPVQIHEILLVTEALCFQHNVCMTAQWPILFFSRCRLSFSLIFFVGIATLTAASRGGSSVTWPSEWGY